MSYQIKQDPKTDQLYLETNQSDRALLANPLLNKSTAFTRGEREQFGLLGFLPPTIEDLDKQCERAYRALQLKNSDLEKHIYLRRLQDSNETLFYALLKKHVDELLAIIYTPTIGAACQRFSEIYRHPRGLFITYSDKENILDILSNPALDKVKLIVVSDGEHILGLGDQGAGGMGIPIGKLSLYSLCASIHPGITLPILLDSGTNNQERLNDPLYLGWRHERVRGKDHDDFIETFVSAVHKHFPNVLLHWEDFAEDNAFTILSRYRHQLCTLNGDIQGTASIAISAVFSALMRNKARIEDQRVVIVGAGSIGCQIGEWLVHAMMIAGAKENEARERIFMVDKINGLITTSSPNLQNYQQKLAQPNERLAALKCQSGNVSLSELISKAHPTILIGVCGQANIFTENMIREMAAHTEHPIIFPLSNPTSKSEATPENLLTWTNGRAIVGTGSPFLPVQYNGRIQSIDQVNNVYIFPGTGLGLIAAGIKYVPDELFIVAAKTLADCSPAKTNPNGALLPDINKINEISFKIALAIAKEGIRLGISQLDSDSDLEGIIRRNMWNPIYLPYRKIE